MKNWEEICWNWSVRKGVLALIIVLGMLTLINAQMSGSRGGVHNFQSAPTEVAKSMVEVPSGHVPEHVTVESKVEIRVVPDQIRIVLAIAENAETSSECETKVFEKIAQLKGAFSELGISQENVVDDFIAILPRYELEVESIRGQNVAVEKLSDYVMQSNLHIKVADDAQALKAIRAAFKLDVTNVIAFDYWSKDLDQKKQEALKQAIAKTQAKSELLFGGTFDQPLKPINVKSATRVIMPDKLYQSFQNSYDQGITHTRQYHKENLPVIKAFRPKNTFYRGYFDEFGDQHSTSVPMRSEISVVAEVAMYYASPVAEEYRMLKAQTD